MGVTYTVIGSGFSVLSEATVSFDSVLETPTGGSDCIYTGTGILTNSSGNFICTFPVPNISAGSYSVLGEDTATSTPTTAEMFTVTTAAIAVTPGQGPMGAAVTVSGTGFSVTSAVGLVFDGVTMASCTSGSLTAGGAGAFSCTFTVPSGTSGTTVTATDVSGQAATGTFTVTRLAITVSPTQGTVGTTVTVFGTGFSVSSLVELVFDGVTIGSCMGGSLTTGGTGAFACTFKMPSGTAGSTVTATDVGRQTATGSATVTTTSSSFPWFWVYVAIVLVAIAAVVLVALFARRTAPPASYGRNHDRALGRGTTFPHGRRSHRPLPAEAPEDVTPMRPAERRPRSPCLGRPRGRPTRMPLRPRSTRLVTRS